MGADCRDRHSLTPGFLRSNPCRGGAQRTAQEGERFSDLSKVWMRTHVGRDAVVDSGWKIPSIQHPVARPPPMIAAAFYKFVALPDFAGLKAPLLAFCEERKVRGTILLAAEGVNGTIAGETHRVREVLDYLRRDPRLADLEHKESGASRQPFYRMKVRLKKEIVTLGVPGVDPTRMAGTYVKPQDWNRLLEDPEVVVVDVRNDYEVALGTFVGAVNPHTRSFSELPAWVRENPALRGKAKVAMFCTGGIRCEKSTAFLRAEGFAEVYHLQGGILKYLETVPESESRWQGECFVFDERVAVGHGLRPGTHDLCRSCRSPVDQTAKQSEGYVEGVSCPACYGQKSAEKQAGLRERQRQVELAKRRGEEHIGRRVEPRKPV